VTELAGSSRLRDVSITKTLFQATLAVHAFFYEHTDGLIGHRLLGVPCLMLRTTGRRSGQTRTNSLVYAQDGGRWLVVASKGGNPKAPAWLHNPRANPQVEVQIGRTRHQATTAEIGHDDPELARLWKLVNDNNGGRYDTYQGRHSTVRTVSVPSPEAEGSNRGRFSGTLALISRIQPPAPTGALAMRRRRGRRRERLVTAFSQGENGTRRSEGLKRLVCGSASTRSPPSAFWLPICATFAPRWRPRRRLVLW
jgi:deazaflavin-dependent oxidoreductase (nitroreductase family)